MGGTTVEHGMSARLATAGEAWLQCLSDPGQ
jgi:hypothetical protein